MKHGTYCYCIWCELVLPITAVAAAMALVLAGVASCINHLEFPAQIITVEQIRSDLAIVAPGDRAELIDTAVQWNRRIVRCRYWNSRWWADFMFADGCNDLEVIDVSP